MTQHEYHTASIETFRFLGYEFLVERQKIRYRILHIFLIEFHRRSDLVPRVTDDFECH